MAVIGLALAVLIGLSLGMLGGGGATLTVPILVYIVGFEPRQSIAMSLAIVCVVSLVGAVGHWREGNVRLRIALGFGPVAMAGSFLGARLSGALSGAAQLLLLAVVMLVAAALMFRNGRGVQPTDEARAGRRSPILVVMVGLGVGVLTGLAGVGGGFLIVPALVLLLALPMKQAIGTSLTVIVLNTAAGLAGYVGRVKMDWRFTAAFALIAVGGILAGTRTVRHVPQAALRRAFAVFLVLVGGFMAYRNRGVLVGAPIEQSAAETYP